MATCSAENTINDPEGVSKHGNEFMEHLKAIVVDNERLAREAVTDLLINEPDIQVIAECKDGLEAVTAIETLSPDIVFLDPGANGFEVIEAIEQKIIPLTIFITAFDQYAIKAFDARAVDYLLKPVEHRRFSEALERARRILDEYRTRSYQDSVIEMLQEIRLRDGYKKRFVIRTRGKSIVVRTSEIVWIEAVGDYVRFHLKDEHHLYHGTISGVEINLDPEGFRRIHRSTIVNIDQIRSLQPLSTGDYEVVLFNGTKLAMSRTYKDKLITAL